MNNPDFGILVKEDVSLRFAGYINRDDVLLPHDMVGKIPSLGLEELRSVK